LYSNLCSNFGFVPRFDADTYLKTIGQFGSGYVSRFDCNKYPPLSPVILGNLKIIFGNLHNLFAGYITVAGSSYICYT
jgi:hypothetical protein